MIFTDFFIKRPVLAAAISLFILAMGLRAIKALPVMQYPFTENAVVTVTTPYVGAGSSLIAGFITTPIETAVSQANGIDYITSSSTPGVSTVTARLLTNYDPFKALSEITSNISGINYQLPTASEQPEITVSTGNSVNSMYIGFSSNSLTINQLTDYLIRVIQPQIQGVAGVQLAQIAGGNTYALRVWLDPEKLAGYGLSATEVNAALMNNDMLSSLGRTDGQMFVQNLMAKTNLVTANQFKKLVIKAQDGAIIHLEDIAKIELGNQA
jgi:multidrug efflux pump